MAVLLVHPTGNANVRAAAQACLEAGWLSAFHTSLGWPAVPWLPGGLRRRGYALPASLLRIHPQLEVARLLAVQAQVTPLLRHERGWLSVDRIYHHLDRAAARSVSAGHRRNDGVKLVYAYEDGALASFQAAHGRGLTTVYELPIGYWRYARAIFAEEADRRPSWAPTLEGLADSPAKLARKDAELAAAHQVIVPSRFVEHTLRHHQGGAAPIHVVPYGGPPPLPALPQRPEPRPLRVLFVGGLSQRKGLADLLEAVDLLGDRISLTLVGRAPTAPCRPLQQALERHVWLPSLSHGAVLEQMRQHHVLVLPSLFEGFPLVLGEALSQGLPLIATTHAAADELITDGLEGFVVPIRDPQAIATRLGQLASDPNQLRAMAAAALARAAIRGWEVYRQNLQSVLAPFLA
ncbi:MAG: glycosyltransferase family 4 protein [Cyanobacteriota bacterium]|nr:glycosyltransferase family 4 protein [Cyanobacteriota bacterium]